MDSAQTSDDQWQRLREVFSKASNSSESVVPFRVPFARRKVLLKEIGGEIWSATRSFFLSRKFPEQFADFWALEARNEYENESSEIFQYVARKSATGVTVNDVIESVEVYIRGVMENRSVEIVEKWMTVLKKSKPALAGSFATRNTRAHMEDFFVCIQNIEHPNLKETLSLYLVLDGHCGAEMAAYVSKHLPYAILSLEEINQFSIREAFLHVQALISEHSALERIGGGTTATLAIILSELVYIAWLGDSQACILQNGCLTFKTSPHLPNRQDEYERISREGGHVFKKDVFRVNGIIGVSRSLGDIVLKPFLSHEPEVRCFRRTFLEDGLIIATDGLYDTITDEEIVKEFYSDTVATQTYSPSAHAAKTASQLVKISQEKGSSDNITVIIVYMQWPLEKKKIIPNINNFQYNEVFFENLPKKNSEI